MQPVLTVVASAVGIAITLWIIHNILRSISGSRSQNTLGVVLIAAGMGRSQTWSHWAESGPSPRARLFLIVEREAELHYPSSISFFACNRWSVDHCSYEAPATVRFGPDLSRKEVIQFQDTDTDGDLLRMPDAKKTPAATRVTPKTLSGVTVSPRKATPPSKARMGVNAPKAAVSAAPRSRTA